MFDDILYILSPDSTILKHFVFFFIWRLFGKIDIFLLF